MSLKFTGRLLLVFFISASLGACKGKDKTKEKETSTDTTMTNTNTNNTSTNTMDNIAGMDAVTVAPNLYKTLADSAGIRIVDVVYKPGDSSAMHWHPDYAIYVAQGGKVTFYAKDGSKMEVDMPTGATMIHGGEFHAAKNTGKNPIHVILFEVSRKGAMGTMDATMDAAKVSPDLYKVKNDSLGIRVVDVNYKPGQQSGMHSHPDAALYVISDGTGEFTGKDGSKHTLEMKKGMAMIRPAESHSVKNVGKTPMKAILVEVNRAQ